MADDVLDRRAHKRIDGLEDAMRNHLKEHTKFELALEENTRMTKAIAENTSEIVDLIKGAKVGRKLILWLAPICAAFVAVWAWFNGAPK